MWLCAAGSTGCGGSDVTDLAPLGGVRGWGINELGHAVGEMHTADSRNRAFVYADGVLTDLGPADAFRIEAYGINDKGQVVGRIRHAGNSPSLAALYDPSEGMQDLGTLGGEYSTAFGINNSGQVVGWADLAGEGREDCVPDSLLCGTEHAFLWENGVMTDLGTLGGIVSQARAINDAGQIVGWAETEEGCMHAALWENGTIIDLGIEGQAYDINESGEIVGSFSTQCESHAFLYRGGELMDLGMLGPYVTEAYGINNRGQVVGYYWTDDFIPRAFLWDDGGFVDLNTLSPPLSGWQFGEAQDINDNGQIVGSGWRAFGAGGGAIILTLPSGE